MSSDLRTRPAEGGHATTSRNLKGTFLRWEMGLLVVLVIVMWAGAIEVPHFLTTTNIFNVSLNSGEIGIMALPMLLIVITGEIDLSVASMLGLSGALAGVLFQAGAGIWVAILAALVVGAIGGFLNGYLVAVLGLPSIAVTIGTLGLYRGIALIILAPNTVTGFPDWFTSIGTVPVFGTLSYSIVIFIVLAVVTVIVLRSTGLGRAIYAAGLQPEAAQFSGIRVQSIKLWLFVLSGVVCALAGLLFTAKNASVSYNAGTGLELTVVAIVLFGGASIFGGKGTAIGVVLSLAVIGFVQQAITQIPASPTIQAIKPQVAQVVIGVLLVLSVVVPGRGEAVRRLLRRRRSTTPGGDGRTVTQPAASAPPSRSADRRAEQ